MSALAGLWRHDGGPCADACAAMLAAQRVYGRDDTATRDFGAIALGRNLTRSLTEDAFDAQPLCGGGGRFVLVADLRLDNRLELARDLGLIPERLRTMSDAEVLLAAYERWGIACCQRLRGDFAFALWDGAERQLLLARDPTGQRPLHYFHTAGLTAFASMPKGLLALPQIERQPDLIFAAQGLVDLSWAGSRSYFKDISRVRPGHVVMIDAAGERQCRYWDPAPEPLRLKDYGAYVEVLRATFDRAVARQLRGLSNVATHLSAGLDSAAVATSAAIHLAGLGHVTAYTAVPRDGYADSGTRQIADEGPRAAAVAARYANIDHRRVRTAQAWSVLDTMASVRHLFDQPCPNPCNMGWIVALNERAKADGHRVLLTGGFGNVTLSYGGEGFLAEGIARGRIGPLLRQLSWLHDGGWGFARPEFTWAIRAALPPKVQRRLGRARGRQAHIAAHPDLSRDAIRVYAPDTVFARKQWFDRTDLGNFNKGVLGGWDIELRDPTADRDLIELCLAIPAAFFCHRGERRSLARDMLADRMPAENLRDSRKGLQGADWHEALARDRRKIGEEIEIFAGSASLSRLLDIERLAQLVTDWPTGNWNAPAVSAPYRAALLRGIAMGDFVRRASDANR